MPVWYLIGMREPSVRSSQSHTTNPTVPFAMEHPSNHQQPVAVIAEASQRPNSINALNQRQSLQAPHTDIAAKQPLLLDPHQISHVYKTQMDAPIENYITTTEKQMETNFSNVPTSMQAEIAPLYVYAVLDQAGATKTPIKNIDLSKEVLDVKPTDEVKLLLGLDAIDEIAAQNPHFNPVDLITNYEQTKFMSAPASAYLDALRAQFPHASENQLATYTLEFLQKHDNQYLQTWWYTNDTSRPITTKPEDIIKSPGTDPTRASKLYGMLESVESIASKYATNTTPVLPSLTSAVGSFVYDTVTGGFVPAAQNFLVHPTVQHSINQGIVFAADAATEKLTSPAQGRSITISQPFIQPATHEALGKALNAVIEKSATTITDVAENARNPETQPAQQHASTPYALTEKTNAAIAKAQEATQILAAEKLTEAVTRTFDFNESTNIVHHAETEKASEKEISSKEDSSLETSENVLKNYTIKDTNSFMYQKMRGTARSIRHTPDKIQSFIAMFISGFAKLFRLTQKQEESLHKEAKQESDELIKNSNSWVNSKDAEFNAKFDAWSQKFTNRLTKLIGKQPTDIQIMHVEQDLHNPNAPQLTLIYNAQDKTIAYIQVQYQGNEYTITPNQPIPVEDMEMYEIPLYKKPIKKSLFQKTVNKKYNEVISELFNNIGQSQGGQALETKAAGTLEKGKDAFLVNQNMQAGTVGFKYDPRTQKLFTHETKFATAQKAVSISVEQEFDQISGNLESKKIILTDNNADVFMPTIKINYLPETSDEHPLGKLTEVTIQHTAKTGKRTTTDFVAKPENIAISPDGKSFVITAITAEPSDATPSNGVSQAFQKLTHALQDAAPQAVDMALSKLKTGETVGTIAHKNESLFAAVQESLVDLTKIGVSPDRINIIKTVITYEPSSNTVTTAITTDMSRGTPRIKTSTYEI